MAESSDDQQAPEAEEVSEPSQQNNHRISSMIVGMNDWLPMDDKQSALQIETILQLAWRRTTRCH